MLKYLPTEETQKYPSFDSYSCTNFSICNLFETYLNKMIMEGTISVGALKFLNDNGYLDKFGKPDFSDQFNAIMSGTKWGVGNYLENVIESVLKDGLVPDSMFTDTPASPEQYFDRTLITQKMINLGREFFSYFNIKVEDRNAPIETLKNDLLWLTIQVCPGYGVDKFVRNCVFQPTHAVLGYGIDDEGVMIYDTYPEYRKKIHKLSVFAKWRLSIQEKIMNKTLKIADKNDIWVIKENRHRIPDIETFSYFEKLGFISMPELVKEEELNKYSIGEALPSIKLMRAIEPIAKDIFNLE